MPCKQKKTIELNTVRIRNVDLFVLHTLKKRWKLGDEVAGAKESFKRCLRSLIVVSGDTVMVVDSPLSVRTSISFTAMDFYINFYDVFFSTLSILSI